MEEADPESIVALGEDATVRTLATRFHVSGGGPKTGTADCGRVF